MAAWSGVTVDQASLLKTRGIRTVEEVRDMGESTFTKLPFPNARKLPELAAAFLKGESAAAKDKKISDMEEQMAVMEEMLSEAIGSKQQPKKKQEVA